MTDKAEKAEKKTDSGEAHVQAQFDAAHEQGFMGQRVDLTPLHHYTLPGVLAGKPTPETDFDAAVEAVKARVAGLEGVQPS
jgi:hypothetical protein